VIELRDRIGSIDSDATSVQSGLPGATASAPWKDQVLHALAGLGFTGKEAIEAIDTVAEEAGENPEVAVILRQTIQLLGRMR
jgi:Holliday junction DNA helicase RuvA